MQMKSFGWALGIAAITSALLGCGQKTDTAAEKAATDAKDKVVADAKAAEALVKEKEAQETSTPTYAYPLVTMERRRVSPTPQHRGAARRWGSSPSCADIHVDDHTVTPNADVVHRQWLDVSKEPWIISSPDMKGRFFLLPMLDGGPPCSKTRARAHGYGRAEVCDHQSGWSGTLPVRKPNRQPAWWRLLGRISCATTPGTGGGACRRTR